MAIVRITGTISRLTTLFLIGEGTFRDVPVLTDVTIVHKPRPGQDNQ